MLSDNETDKDFLNFSGLADTVAEVILQAEGKPVSIGISGSWGIGKSSMLKLTESSLREREEETKDFVFVTFNAWLYQGYDDARAALLDVIATTLAEEADKRQTGLDKVRELATRVNWLRAARLTGVSAAALFFGVPPPGLLGALTATAGSIKDGLTTKELHAGDEALTDGVAEAKGLLKPRQQESPPKEIDALRKSFEEALEELGITLVVFIDDLDRCLPDTTISTLEAFRLFTFLRHTAFVVAADDNMIRHAVRKHFDGVPNETAVINYFDKLIQVPIRVPALGTQEVRAYMMMLFIEESGDLDEDELEAARATIATQLRKSWQGARVDRSFVVDNIANLSEPLKARLEMAERLSPLMTTGPGIAGNPRLVKRFLNALSIRMAISKAQGVDVDEAVLAKLMLFERLGEPGGYEALTAAVTSGHDGIFAGIEELESLAVTKGKLPSEWSGPFASEWLTMSPSLAGRDLRGALYVSREHAPLITPEDQLSPRGLEILGALLDNPKQALQFVDFSVVSPTDLTVIMGALINTARAETAWGVPAILDALLAVADRDEGQAQRLVTFLCERPATQITAAIMPKIGDKTWADEVFQAWLEQNIATPVQNAIEKKRAARGNLAKE